MPSGRRRGPHGVVARRVTAIFGLRNAEFKSFALSQLHVGQVDTGRSDAAVRAAAATWHRIIYMTRFPPSCRTPPWPGRAVSRLRRPMATRVYPSRCCPLRVLSEALMYCPSHHGACTGDWCGGGGAGGLSRGALVDVTRIAI